MPSRRMISPAFWRSESMAQLTKEQRLLFIGLISNADDQGRLRAHPLLIRSDVFPFEDEPPDKIGADLEAIAATGSILIYSANGKQYLQIVNWWTYQKPKWAWPSEKPAPEGWADRLHYRIGNESMKTNWDGSEAAGDSKLGESETIVEPEGNQNETTANSAPSTRTSNSDSTSISNSKDSPTAGADAPSPPSEPKAELKKRKRKDPSPKQQAARDMFEALAKVCQIDLVTITGTQRKQLNQSEKILRKDDAIPADMEPFATWWYANDWRGKKGDAPRPAQVRETWGQFKSWRERGQSYGIRTQSTDPKAPNYRPPLIGLAV